MPAEPNTSIATAPWVQIRIPERAGVSAGAIDLLRHLLRRAPSERLNFVELYELRYLDMDHRPGAYVTPRSAS